MVSQAEAGAMTVAALKLKLSDLGLPVTGKKEELVSRYVQFLSASVASQPSPEEVAVAPMQADPSLVPIAAASEPSAIEETNTHALEAGGKPKIVFPAEVPGKADAVPKPQSEVEKAKLRAERFGLTHPEIEKEKSMKRAERFGLTHPEIEKEKALKRAERFGVAVPELEEAKKQKRAARFLADDKAPSTGAGNVADEILASRAKRFASSSSAADDEKLRARAARFA